MASTRVRIAMIVTLFLSGTALAQTDDAVQLRKDRTEFSLLMHQRNDLYAQLALVDELAVNGDEDAAHRTKWTQDQLDVVERRLSDLAERYGLSVPRRQTLNAAPEVTWSEVAMASSGGMQPFSPKQKADFNKLLYHRNKLYGQLTTLDKQASDLIKNGENPLVVHAQQVSVQDQLDLVELRLAILATRHGITVPPLAGRDPMPDGRRAVPEDDSNRNLEQAFARGRDRAVKQLRDDAEQFMTSLEFGAFLND